MGGEGGGGVGVNGMKLIKQKNFCWSKLILTFFNCCKQTDINSAASLLSMLVCANRVAVEKKLQMLQNMLVAT